MSFDQLCADVTTALSRAQNENANLKTDAAHMNGLIASANERIRSLMASNAELVEALEGLLRALASDVDDYPVETAKAFEALFKAQGQS